jgi:hypothetical protein
MDTKEIKEELKELSERIKMDWETDPDDVLKIIELFDEFITLIEKGIPYLLKEDKQTEFKQIEFKKLTINGITVSSELVEQIISAKYKNGVWEFFNNKGNLIAVASGNVFMR